MKLRGRHQRKFVMRLEINTTISASHGSMMNQDVKLLGTYRTLYKLSTKSPFVRVGVYNKYIHKGVQMSVLHHEALLESCFDQAWEDFRVHNELSVEQMNEIESHEGVQIALRRSAERMMEDMA